MQGKSKKAGKQQNKDDQTANRRRGKNNEEDELNIEDEDESTAMFTGQPQLIQGTMKI